MSRLQFTEMVRQLLNFCYREGIKIQIDYVKSSYEEQKRLVETGKSWTMNSKHLLGKAIDLQIIKDGKFLVDGEEYEILGKYWESLSPNNIWGGRWKNKDVYHFETS